MMLSEIRGERTIDVIADLIPPIARIAKDSGVRQLFERRTAPNGMPPAEFFAERVEKAAPKLLKAHRADVILILATMSDKTVDEYTEGLTPITLINDFLGLMTDDTLLDFLPSSGTSEGGSLPTDS